ncbi:uncharacterized protein ARMOST_16777 [Armillaria ostoyae]|uniref:Uncharacterized protein n=1 Tax=Armillaria ostoyae TaxID=47428 RepID=A0A284RX56_ARMOS|nr:uncharacterized protein ARMOST_16777 [Armillaria ostoyae]
MNGWNMENEETFDVGQKKRKYSSTSLPCLYRADLPRTELELSRRRLNLLRPVNFLCRLGAKFSSAFRRIIVVRTWFCIYQEDHYRHAVSDEAPLLSSECYVNTFLM